MARKVPEEIGEIGTPPFESQVVQGAESRQDIHYDNDVPSNSWLRSDGTKKPAFDKGNAWRKGRGL